MKNFFLKKGAILLTDDAYTRAKEIEAEKTRIESRLNEYKDLKDKMKEQKMDVACLYYPGSYAYVSLLLDDVEVLIDHEEMKLGECERKFKEL